MEIELEIKNLRSKHQVEKLIRWVGTDKKRFGRLMKYFLDGDTIISKHSAWVIGHCCERSPEFAKPWLKPMIKKLNEPVVHDAIKRNVMRILQFVDIPKQLKGTVANLCFEYIADTKAGIAPQAFAMTVLSKISKNEPDLMNELQILIRHMLPYGTPAFRARARKIFKNLDINNKDAIPGKNEEDKLLHDWLMEKE